MVFFETHILVTRFDYKESIASISVVPAEHVARTHRRCFGDDYLSTDNQASRVLQLDTKRALRESSNSLLTGRHQIHKDCIPHSGDGWLIVLDCLAVSAEHQGWSIDWLENRPTL
jgi:hypothetical protein